MVPDVSYGVNSVLVQASSAIDLRCNESQGRFLIVSVISVVVVRWCNKHITVLFEPRCEKTGLRGFRQCPTQTGLYNHTRWLEASNFVFRK